MMNLIMAVNETIWVDVLEKKKKKRFCHLLLYILPTIWPHRISKRFPGNTRVNHSK